MNDENVKKILNDLYALDPSLRSREKELITLLHAMAIKPEAHYDPAFAATLRARLLNELSANPPKRYTLADIFMSRPIRYAAGTIAVLAIAVVVVTNVYSKPGGGILAFNSTKPSITTVGPNAFGTLSTLTSGSATNGAATTGANTGASAGATGAQTPAEATPMGAAAGTAGGTSVAAGSAGTSAIAMPIRPINLVYFNSVTYAYTGAPFSQDQSSLDVLKKVTEPFNADQATAALEQMGFGPINLSSFDNLSMSNVTLSQNESFGYDISLDFADGTMSINENYNEWPQGGTTPLSASNVPSNSAVIAIANQFLSAHSISTANYGAPQVSPTAVAVPVAMSANAGSGSASSADMPMIPYYSDSEQVLYPLMINGENVYDTNGDPIGMTVTVNVQYNRVSDIYGLGTQSYQASAYSAITSTSTILSMAEVGQSYYPEPVIFNGKSAGAGTVSVESQNNVTSGSGTTLDLGTPTMAYEDMYQTDSNGQSTEFLVPAFAFPVVNGSSDAQQQIIMVPLISEFAQPNTGRAIPLNAPSAGGGSAGAPTAE